jgi:septum formation topological specificity factor MinE
MYSIVINKPTIFNQLFTIIQKGSKDAKKTISGINEQIKKSQLEALRSDFIRIFEIYIRTSESRIAGETRQFDDKQTLLVNIATQLRPLLSGGSS